MKSLLGLLREMLADASIWCRASTARDLEEITKRVKYEGLSFFTITLPNFARDFEQALEQGSAANIPFRFFKRRKGRKVPEFLRGLTWQVFDAETGVLLQNPSIEAISFVRQICLPFKKLELPCSSEREFRAFRAFWECEHEVADHYDTIDYSDLSLFSEVASCLFGTRLQGVNHEVRELKHIPRHGSGATADRIVGNNKYDIREWHKRLETFFPSDSFVVPNSGHIERLQEVNFIEPGDERPVRVVSVPKTLKTPRIIAIEPLCMQYAQQSLLIPLVSALEHSSFSDALGFSSQRINQQRALLSSKDGSLATLDLSEASDRVHNRLAYSVLNSIPDFRDAAFACRSMRADIPGYGVLTLAKFASMGSALCFPIEAMVFLTVVCVGILKAKNTRVTIESVNSILPRVRVYGDDIIVPVEYAHAVTKSLETYGLKVNTNKSFKLGKFRESCGMDAYDGTEVTPTYVTKMAPTSLRDASEMLAWISLRNHFYLKGMWKSCSYVAKIIKKFAKIPYVLEKSPVKGFFSFLGYEAGRYNRNLHRFEVKGIVVNPTYDKSTCSFIGALMKFFLRRGEDPFNDVKHLERHGRPKSVDIKIRWATPF